MAQNFPRDGTIREKYNVVDGSANIAVAAGYKENVVGFGWTNAVYLMLENLLDRKPLNLPNLPEPRPNLQKRTQRKS